LSVIHLAVDFLKVRKIIVCGHTNCKGVEVALTETRLGGELDGWLRNLRDVRAKYSKELDAIPDTTERERRLVEYNVMEQVRHVCRNDRVIAQKKLRELEVHGLVYDVATGLLREVEVPKEAVDNVYNVA
jgi:carbonic anhydrase